MRTEYIQLNVLPGNKQDVINEDTMHIPLHSFQIPAYHKETKKSPKFFAITLASKALFIKVCNTWLQYEKCMCNRKNPVANLKVDLWFQKVVLCLGHRQMPKLFFNVHFPLGKMPSHNILCDIPGGKLWPHLFHGEVSDTDCKLKRDHPYYAQVQGQLEPSGVILLRILERGFTLRDYQLMQPIGRTFSINSLNIFWNLQQQTFKLQRKVI